MLDDLSPSRIPLARRVIAWALRAGMPIAVSLVLAQKILRPAWLSLFLLIGMKYAFAVVLLAFHARAPLWQPNDTCFSLIFYLVLTPICLFLSLWGTEDLKGELKGGTSTDSLNVLLTIAFPLFAAYQVVQSQQLLRDVSPAIESAIHAHGPGESVVSALRFSLTAWALFMAYKFKIFWDAAATWMGASSSRAKSLADQV